ncbi:hypothetical protein KAU37_09080 [Candidatus Bipolaricaulota bacterium]|nr:hypothetical protein [Candidatus Bipolaricaulota bacterium]
MSKYFQYAAIYQTTLIRSWPAQAIVDPVKIEFFSGPRVFRVPVQTAMVLAEGNASAFSQSMDLLLKANKYIVITVRTEDKNPFTAKKFCEDNLDGIITNFSLLYDPGLFAQQVYRGWLLEEKKGVMEAWVQIKKPFDIRSDIGKTIQDMRDKQSNDTDVNKRYKLMSHFFVKSLPISPSEEKFLYLWTMLEIFPMKDTTNIKPLCHYVANIVGRDSEVVKEQLGIGKLFGARSNLVHDGELTIPISELGEIMGKLELICIEVLRYMNDLEYSDSLEKYF